MRITEKELSQRKDRLLHVAYKLFCEYGIDSVTLIQVAQEAGVGLSSIYRYFDSKSTLIQYTQKILWQEIVEQILSEESEKFLSAKNGYEEVAVLLNNFNSLYSHHNGYLLFACEYKLYLVRNSIKLPEQVYKDMISPIYSLFIKALRRGQSDGSISTTERAEDQFFALWGIVRGYVEQMVVYDKMYDAENPWKGRLELVLLYTLEGIKNKA